MSSSSDNVRKNSNIHIHYMKSITYTIWEL